MEAVRTISRDELKTKIDHKESFVLLETLPRTAYDHSHLPGALNLPPDQIRELTPKLVPDKTTDLILYCASPT